jgi:hypothetical protein
LIHRQDNHGNGEDGTPSSITDVQSGFSAEVECMQRPGSRKPCPRAGARCSVVERGFCRRGEIVARAGGEEFVGLLSGLSWEKASQIAEKIRQSVEELEIFHECSSTAKVFIVSIGVAAFAKVLVNTTKSA